MSMGRGRGGYQPRQAAGGGISEDFELEVLQ